MTVTEMGDNAQTAAAPNAHQPLRVRSRTHRYTIATTTPKKIPKSQ